MLMDTTQVSQRTVNQALRNTIQTPSFPPKIPPTLVEMCDQYRVNGLQGFETAKMISWAMKLKMSYGRRKYLNNKVKERTMRLNIGTIEQRMLRAAETMDEERLHLGQSTAGYVSHLKKHDTVVKKRKRGNDVL